MEASIMQCNIPAIELDFTAYTRDFICPQTHYYNEVKSADLGNQPTRPCHPIQRFWKCWFGNEVSYLPKWGVQHLAAV